jgi:hypothetical protein
MTEQLFARKCQECFHIQAAQEPKGMEPSDAYCNAKCRRCKSMALNYGHSRHTRDSTGKIIEMQALPYAD